MGGRPSSWSDAEDRLLRSSVADGLSAAEICGKLPVRRTRSAVIGRVHRLGLSLGSRITSPKGDRAVAARQDAGRNGRSAVMASPAPPAKPVAPSVWSVPATALELLALSTRHCRWPVGAAVGAEQLFCGSVRAGADVYCAPHRDAAGGRQSALNHLWDGQGKAPRWARQ